MVRRSPGPRSTGRRWTLPTGRSRRTACSGSVGGLPQIGSRRRPPSSRPAWQRDTAPSWITTRRTRWVRVRCRSTRTTASAGGPALAYLTPAVRARTNLEIRPFTSVRRVEVDRGRVDRGWRLPGLDGEGRVAGGRGDRRGRRDRHAPPVAAFRDRAGGRTRRAWDHAGRGSSGGRAEPARPPEGMGRLGPARRRDDRGRRARSPDVGSLHRAPGPAIAAT